MQIAWEKIEIIRDPWKIFIVFKEEKTSYAIEGTLVSKQSLLQKYTMM